MLAHKSLQFCEIFVKASWNVMALRYIVRTIGSCWYGILLWKDDLHWKIAHFEQRCTSQRNQFD